MVLLAGMIGAAEASEPREPEYSFADLPNPITSFGAAAAGNWIYVLGGHTGQSHDYSVETTLPDFIRIARDGSGDWEKLAPGVRSQGASLVSHDGKIYRIGGMAPREKEDEEVELHSLDDFARFDPSTGEWESLAPMPAGRSSHDSVVVGDRLYVLGGWEMTGETSEKNWHDTMFVADLSRDRIVWETAPQPFQRRAIAAGALNGRLYAMGGMGAESETSLEVDVYDIRAKQWSQGPKLPAGVMKGFGAVACVLDDRLYVSLYSKDVVCLSEDGNSWEAVAELKNYRFFHRLVPVDSNHLVAIGGANRADGHLDNLEVISISGH